MASLNKKVKLYLEANSKTWNAEQNSIEVRNESNGNGDYIHTWNVSGLSKPTDSQLATYETAGNTETNNDVIRATRRLAYGTIGDQLDLLYKDMVAGKLDTTGEWAKAIKAVKDDNPKE